MNALQVVYWIAAFITLAEAMNKLERTDPLAAGLSPRERWVQWLKGLAWALLAFGSAGIVAIPGLPFIGVVLTEEQACLLREIDAAVIALGFSVLIIRTRVKEG